MNGRMDRSRARFHRRSGDVRAFVSRVGDERGRRILARVGRRRARGATRIGPDWGFVATVRAVATSRARRARSTRRRGRVVADASGTLRFDDSVEHGRDDAIARNRGRSEGRTSRCASRFDAEPPPDRDEGDPRRVISTPACAARCGGDGRSRRFAGSAELAMCSHEAEPAAGKN